jgi:NDP-sugar pyrophosphorylase family protein
MYIFNKSAFAFFPDKKVFSIEYDVFPKMRDLYVYKSKKPWIDVGLPDRLEWARQNFKIFA